MQPVRSVAKGLLIFGLSILAACENQDWRTRTIGLAESKMRSDVGDPSAQFTRVQVTGDDKTGQTCGVVTAKIGLYATQETGRFIVYIDNTAGPYVEAGMGRQSLSQPDFDSAWNSDCIKEGYSA